MSEIDRRQVLGVIAAGAVTAGVNPAARPAERNPDLIRVENARPGTTDWQLTYVKFDPKAKFRQSLIEGYCDRMSVAAGEKLTVFVSTDRPTPVTIDVYRLGYYGGA